ncbi:DNA polymerase III subunit beta [Candidatus Saccharibacteria bacterium]|nr:MAG: DNA polymerase III subunit beta [Candidatus Saccharibacteria bacterium]
MKLKVTQENLSKALGYVARVANNRGTLPVLANVLLSIENNRLKLATTNLEIAISCTIGAQVQNEGTITVPARLFQELVSGLPSGVIELEQDEQRLKISADQYKSVINGVSADEFPVMPAIEKGATLTISAQTMKEALQQVLFAASNDESRPVLTGVCVRSRDGALYFAATDSYRLAEKKLHELNQDIAVLIPASALHDVLRVISDKDEDVTVLYDEQQALFTVGDVEIVARLIEGNYPDYRKLIPSTFQTTATLSRAEFVNIVKVTSLFARESAGSVMVNVDEASNSIWVRAVASQLGENNATTSVKAEGSGSITLNSRYLLEALQAMNGKDVTIGFNGKVEAVLLSDPAEDDYKHIIMPLKS